MHPDIVEGKSGQSRIFFAIPACDDLRSAVDQLRNYNSDMEGIRWVPPQNMHMTIHFVGEISNRKIPELIAAVPDDIHVAGGFKMVFEKFSLEGGKLNRPSMIWARFFQSPGFISLVSTFRDASMEFMPEPVKFKEPIPHITLARIRTRVIPKLTGTFTCEIPIHEVGLWKTVHITGGVRYEVLHRFGVRQVEV